MRTVNIYYNDNTSLSLNDTAIINFDGLTHWAKEELNTPFEVKTNSNKTIIIYRQNIKYVEIKS